MGRGVGVEGGEGEGVEEGGEEIRGQVVGGGEGGEGEEVVEALRGEGGGGMERISGAHELIGDRESIRVGEAR